MLGRVQNDSKNRGPPSAILNIVANLICKDHRIYWASIRLLPVRETTNMRRATRTSSWLECRCRLVTPCRCLLTLMVFVVSIATDDVKTACSLATWTARVRKLFL